MGKFPSEFKYSESHEYVSINGTIATIGITDYATEQLGDVVYVELPKVGDNLTKDSTFGVVESVKAVSDLYLPVTGKVLEVNETLSDNPELLTEEPYGRGWIVRVEMGDDYETKELMDAAAYEEFVGNQ